MLLPLAAATSRLRLPLMLVGHQQQQWQEGVHRASLQQQHHHQHQQQRQVQLLPFWQQIRGLKYMPFHNRRKKPRKIPLPPPVFAVDALAVAPDAQSLLIDEQQQQQQQQQEQHQLSPYQAVQVLQAFLPLQPQHTQGGLSAKTAKQQQQQQQEQEQQQQQEEDAAIAAPEKTRESEEDTPSSLRLSRSAPLIYLMMKVRADLKRESVRGVCTLQHGVGSSTKLAVFCSDEEAPQLLALGADFAGCDALIQRVAKGVFYGYYPTHHSRSTLRGTVVSDLMEAVRGMKSGRIVEFRAEGEGMIKAPLGRIDFSREQLLENCKCLVSEGGVAGGVNVLKAQPRSRSGGGEATASSAKHLEWPPPSFLSRRKQRLSRDTDASAVGRGIDIEGREKNQDFFISSASLSAEGTPEIHLMPHALHPSSPGYFR
ncbi:hypothetical protein ACSSS7_005617 [Eimeria intestinalis]